MEIDARPNRRELVLRPLGQEARAEAVRCDRGPVNVEPSAWDLPPECRQLTWRIPLRRLDARYNPATQASAYDPDRKQVLVFEWGALPRVPGRPPPRVCLHHVEGETCRLLPPDHRPPLILTAGFTASTSGAWGTLFADRPENAALAAAAAGFARQLESLEQLLGKAEEPVALLWLARNPDSLNLGGVAGSDLIIANYPAGRVEPDAAGLLLARWISAHEAVHTLSDTPMPVWASESLAHYLGYRTLAADIGTQRASDLWDRFMSGPATEVGLPELGARAEDGDPRARVLIYLHGARFWADLERVYGQASASGQESFDRLLSVLHRSAWPSGYRFPDDACALVTARVRDATWRDLAMTNLGADPCVPGSESPTAARKLIGQLTEEFFFDR